MKRGNMKKKRIRIIYEDKFILVVDKPAGLLTVATPKEKEKTLFHQVYTYMKDKNKNSRIFIVHRLDKDTSGLVVFAKTEEIKRQLQNNWDEVAIKRQYVALVEGNVIEKSKALKSYLTENSILHTYSTTAAKGKAAITKYKVLSKGKYTFLEIEILTGRKNQIRVQLSDLGNPIVGDKKYGSKSNLVKRMTLHANRLDLVHPRTHKTMTFESKIPGVFYRLGTSKNTTQEK
jgi:23S rRNA pseudouridine1911/1915/1917 synthase